MQAFFRICGKKGLLSSGVYDSVWLRLSPYAHAKKGFSASKLAPKPESGRPPCQPSGASDSVWLRLSPYAHAKKRLLCKQACAEARERKAAMPAIRSLRLRLAAAVAVCACKKRLFCKQACAEASFCMRAWLVVRHFPVCGCLWRCSCIRGRVSARW